MDACFCIAHTILPCQPATACQAHTPMSLNPVDPPPALLSCGAAPTACLPAQMVADARDLGIPASAIPQLPTNPTEAELRAARDRLAGMIASFLSSGL